jgi:glycosyltransferase involved in cell wall biosynthesis
VTARLAYLTSRYPAPSHAFILREVETLRSLGWEIQTMSIQRAGDGDILSAGDAEAAHTTFALRPVSVSRVVRAHLRCMSRRPGRYARGLCDSISLGRGARGRVWQVFYFVEAVCFYEHCRQERITHIHAHHADPAGDVAMKISGLAPGFERLTWSFTAHGSDVNHSDRRLLRAKCLSASAVVCVSEHGAEIMRAVAGDEARSKISVVHTGVDPDSFSSLPGRPRERARSILCVGRLDPLKGHAVLLDALALLLTRGQEFVLSVVGAGPERAGLENQARSSGLAERVSFLGSVANDDLPQVYADADLFCLPSLSEGVPVVLMEAMATELPVISTRITGIPELVDEQAGILVEPGSVPQLADALERVLGSSREVRGAMGEHGRATVRDRFDRRETARALARVFETVMGSSPGPIRAGRGG